jgi:hypothetical protein
MALLFLFRFIVLHVNYSPAGEARGEQDQSPVGIDRQSFCEFLEVHSLTVLTSYADRDLHQHPLAAPPSSRMYGCIRDLSHATSPKLNYTWLLGIVEDIPAVGIQSGNRVS